jgi:hypothetical protein
LSKCSLFHFLPQTQSPCPSSQLFLTQILFALFSCHRAPYFNYSPPHYNFLTILSAFCNAQFFCSVLLSQYSLFHIFQHITHFFSIKSTVFTQIYRLCSHVTVLLISFLHTHYNFLLHPVSCLYPQLCSIVIVFVISILSSHYTFLLHSFSCLYTKFIWSVPFSQCSLFHFFPHTTISHSILSDICNPQFISYFPLSQCPLFNFLLTRKFPTPSSHLFVTHNLSAMFQCHSAPYLISSHTINFPSPTSQLFVPTNYLLCSIFTVLLNSILPTFNSPSLFDQLFVLTLFKLCSMVTVLLISILPSYYYFSLHPGSSLYQNFVCSVPFLQCSLFYFFPHTTLSFSIESPVCTHIFLLYSIVTVLQISHLPSH